MSEVITNKEDFFEVPALVFGCGAESSGLNSSQDFFGKRWLRFSNLRMS